jgi:hypothetical protein
MFLGHFAVGFGAKRVAPSVSLGTLFLAAQFADLLWPSLVLLRIERVEIVPGATTVTPLDFVSYPWSHSLLALVLWGVMFGVVHWLVRRSPAAAVTVAAVVMSHWVLDWVTHRPDLPLTFTGDSRFGLGLWNSVPATVLAEAGLFALGVWIYARRTRAVDRAGTWGLWALTGFLLAIFAVSLAGPPPPSVTAVAWAGQAMWLIVLAGYWLDRRRTAVLPSTRN